MSAHPSPNKRVALHGVVGGATSLSGGVGGVVIGGGTYSATVAPLPPPTAPTGVLKLNYHVPVTIAAPPDAALLMSNGGVVVNAYGLAGRGEERSGGDSSVSPPDSGGRESGGGGGGGGGGSGSSALEEEEIPVGVDGRVKVLTGVTKRTTCDDIIYALLLQNDLFSKASGFDRDVDGGGRNSGGFVNGIDDDGGGGEGRGGGSGGDSSASTPRQVEVERWTLVERWRDVERPLQGKTKILKVWRAWGSEQTHVTFQLRSRGATNVSALSAANNQLSVVSSNSSPSGKGLAGGGGGGRRNRTSTDGSATDVLVDGGAPLYSNGEFDNFDYTPTSSLDDMALESRYQVPRAWIANNAQQCRDCAATAASREGGGGGGAVKGAFTCPHHTPSRSQRVNGVDGWKRQASFNGSTSTSSFNHHQKARNNNVALQQQRPQNQQHQQQQQRQSQFLPGQQPQQQSTENAPTTTQVVNRCYFDIDQQMVEQHQRNKLLHQQQLQQQQQQQLQIQHLESGISHVHLNPQLPLTSVVVGEPGGVSTKDIGVNFIQESHQQQQQQQQQPNSSSLIVSNSASPIHHSQQQKRNAAATPSSSSSSPHHVAYMHQQQQQHRTSSSSPQFAANNNNNSKIAVDIIVANYATTSSSPFKKSSSHVVETEDIVVDGLTGDAMTTTTTLLTNGGGGGGSGGAASSTSSESGVVDGCGSADGNNGVVITEQSLLVETIARQRKVLDDLERRLGHSQLAMEKCESSIHQRRREVNGENYLQDAYLTAAVVESEVTAESAVTDTTVQGAHDQDGFKRFASENVKSKAKTLAQETLATLSSVSTDQLVLFLQICDQVLGLEDELEESKWRLGSVQAVLQGEALETAFQQIGKHEVSEVRKRQEAQSQHQARLGLEISFMAEEIGHLEKTLNDKMAVYNKLQSEIMFSDQLQLRQQSQQPQLTLLPTGSNNAAVVGPYRGGEHLAPYPAVDPLGLAAFSSASSSIINNSSSLAVSSSSSASASSSLVPSSRPQFASLSSSSFPLSSDTPTMYPPSPLTFASSSTTNNHTSASSSGPSASSSTTSFPSTSYSSSSSYATANPSLSKRLEMKTTTTTTASNSTTTTQEATRGDSDGGKGGAYNLASAENQHNSVNPPPTGNGNPSPASSTTSSQEEQLIRLSRSQSMTRQQQHQPPISRLNGPLLPTHPPPPHTIYVGPAQRPLAHQQQQQQQTLPSLQLQPHQKQQPQQRAFVPSASSSAQNSNIPFTPRVPTQVQVVRGPPPLPHARVVPPDGRQPFSPPPHLPPHLRTRLEFGSSSTPPLNNRSPAPTFRLLTNNSSNMNQQQQPLALNLDLQKMHQMQLQQQQLQGQQQPPRQQQHLMRQQRPLLQQPSATSTSINDFSSVMPVAPNSRMFSPAPADSNA